MHNNKEIRIGVFICHCGTNIRGVVDVPEVVEYAKKLENVVYSDENLYTCSEDGLQSIKIKIKEKKLNRVIVASCTPRTHEPLFKRACEQAGLNKYLFEFVNIREQCSWIHMHEPKKATEKAKTLVEMGVAKARILEEQEEEENKINPTSLVIGGGIAGMTSALNLANQGFKVHLVEKEELGGILNKIYKIFPTNENVEKILQPIIEEVKNNEKINLYLKNEVEEVNGYIGNFDIKLKNGKEFNVGTIILATGAKEFKPFGFYKYGKLDGVITQLELESLLKNNFHANSVVMINCVCARGQEVPYCSRFCCMTAIKNAILIKEENPNANIYILYRDIMSYGKEFEAYYKKAMEIDIKFLEYDINKPPKILGKEKVEGIEFYSNFLRENLKLDADYVVLTTPLIHDKDNLKLSRMLKVPLGKEGFFLEGHVKLKPVEFATDGIFICGSAHWPVDIREAVAQALGASAKASIPMRKERVKVEAITAYVNENECIGCGNCKKACPYNAIELVEINKRIVSNVNSAQCKGCGNCIASCPNGAIQQKCYTDKQLLNMINALSNRKFITKNLIGVVRLE